jgi:hypothetical protein
MNVHVGACNQDVESSMVKQDFVTSRTDDVDLVRKEMLKTC